MPDSRSSLVGLGSFHACEQLPGLSCCGFYAVYDGHGGDVRQAISLLTDRDTRPLMLAARYPRTALIVLPPTVLVSWQRASSFCADRMHGYLTKSKHFKSRELAKVRALVVPP